MRSQPERLRLTAWQILLARKELQESLPTDRLIREFLAEPTPTIRRIQLSILRRRQDVLTLDDLAKLQSGGFADVVGRFFIGTAHGAFVQCVVG